MLAYTIRRLLVGGADPHRRHDPRLRLVSLTGRPRRRRVRRPQPAARRSRPSTLEAHRLGLDQGFLAQQYFDWLRNLSCTATSVPP